jgi:hypothetical protein
VQGIDTLLQILASKQQSKIKTQVEQTCGKRPLFGKEKLRNYYSCVANFARQQQQIPSGSRTQMGTGAVAAIVIGSLVLAGGITYMIIRKKPSTRGIVSNGLKTT